MADASKKPGWGILGVGGISNDFCVSLLMNGSNIAAIGARDAERARAFGERFGAGSSYGSYEGVAGDSKVDIVYVGTINTTHVPLVKLALEAGKHVLVEKPMAVNEADAKELVELARAKKLFLMEGMWTRFFPAVRKVREVLASGELGAPKYVMGDLGFCAPMDDSHRVWDPEQAGGAILDLGCYVLQAATMAFGASVPDRIACTGQVSDRGLDKEGALSLTWEGKGSASLLVTILANTPETVRIICEKGNVEICSPAHCPTRIIINKEKGRGDFEPTELSFELPKLPEGHTVNFPISEGLLYEVQEVEKCLRDGLLECPEFKLDESLVLLRITDTYRKQLGVRFPFEK